MALVDRHGLWTDDQARAAAEVEKRIAAEAIHSVRLSFADQHGVLRGKTIVAAACASTMRAGCTITTTLLAKDTSHKTVFPVFTAGGGFGMREMEGAADVLMVPDPTTFRTLPWAPGTGWMLCDLYFADGRPVPFSTRRLYRGVLDRLAERGFEFMAGLEVEFHVFKLDDARLKPQEAGSMGQPGLAPEVSLLSPGYQYLTEQRYDLIEPVVDILRRDVQALGLPLRTMECELGPSQFEFTFDPGIGLAPADNMVLFRSAVKQIARRHGYHATFMCRPRVPNTVSSGWHLHQSLRDIRTGANAFVPEGGDMLSGVSRPYLGGLLRHARAGAVFSTPTINGYKRYRPYSLAPDRVLWGRDNRGVMLRVLGAAGDPASRIENRIGEPAANPYLYMASQVLAGLDGIATAADPGASADTPYETQAPALPRSLGEALAELENSALFAEGFGRQFVDYYVQIKRAELARYDLEVSEWEQREYFEMF